eukprot:15473972-Alexandrium_andersonii.AAC.1
MLACSLSYLPSQSQQQWGQKNEYVTMQVKHRLTEVLDKLDGVLEHSKRSEHMQARQEQAAIFTERRLEGAFLPASDFYRHWEEQPHWLQRRQLKPEAELPPDFLQLLAVSCASRSLPAASCALLPAASCSFLLLASCTFQHLPAHSFLQLPVAPSSCLKLPAASCSFLRQAREHK